MLALCLITTIAHYAENYAGIKAGSYLQWVYILLQLISHSFHYSKST